MQDLELWGATLIDTCRAEPLADAVVTLRGDRIVAVRQGPPTGLGDSRDLRGGFLIPGLIDCHTHADATWVFSALSAQGITAFRNPATLRLADFRRARTAVPTSMRCAGPPLDGPGSPIDHAVIVTDRRTVQAEIDRQAAAEVDYIKLYNRLPLELVKVAIEEAHQLGIEVIGDLVATSWTDAARAGIDFLCHGVPRHPSLLPPQVRDQYSRELETGKIQPHARWLELVDLDGPEIAEMIGALVDHKVAVDPTLVCLESILFCGDPLYHEQIAGSQSLLTESLRRTPPELSPAAVSELRRQARPVWQKLLRLVELLHRAGVTILAGSDSPRPWVAPGVSLHRELELLVAAGLEPMAALRAATCDAAAALRISDECGSIAPGKRADLIFLRADPLASIKNTQTLDWVIKAGTLGHPMGHRTT